MLLCTSATPTTVKSRETKNAALSAPVARRIALVVSVYWTIGSSPTPSPQVLIKNETTNQTAVTDALGRAVINANEDDVISGVRILQEFDYFIGSATVSNTELNTKNVFIQLHGPMHF